MLVQKPVNFQNMVASDISFVIDDFVERDRIKLSHVVNVVNSKPRQYEAKAVFLRNFVDCLVLASFKIKKSPDHNKMSEKDLIKRKEEILMRLTQLKKNEKKDKKDAILKLLRIKGIKEIICDGVKKTIRLLHSDGYYEETEMKFENLEELNSFILFLSDLLHIHIDEGKPFLDGPIENRYHVQATFGTEFFKPKFVISNFF